MAQWGQGDERWIVDERKDGQNVNQWHWSEKDCMNWSRQRFQQLFEGASLAESANVTASVTSIDKVEGEAFLNVRKKKIIPSYEIELVMSFKAVVGDDTVLGKVRSTKTRGRTLSNDLAKRFHSLGVQIYEREQRARCSRLRMLSLRLQAWHLIVSSLDESQWWHQCMRINCCVRLGC
jgi:hypothetical protein